MADWSVAQAECSLLDAAILSGTTRQIEGPRGSTKHSGRRAVPETHSRRSARSTPPPPSLLAESRATLDFDLACSPPHLRGRGRLRLSTHSAAKIKRSTNVRHDPYFVRRAMSRLAEKIGAKKEAPCSTFPLCSTTRLRTAGARSVDSDSAP